MTYRVEHSFAGDTLKVVLSGSVARENVAALVRDVAELAGQRAGARLFVDVRGLGGKIGLVDTLRLVESYPVDNASWARRVAVLETREQAPDHYFHETVARNRGRVLRHFTDAAEAAAWLSGAAG